MSNDADGGDGNGGEDPQHGPSTRSGEDKTVPRVDLTLRGLSVSVTGRSEDDLESVERSAQALMAYLVEEADELSEEPDEYGLS